MKKQLKRKVRKSGNSYIVTLPAEVLDSLGVQEGENIQFDVEKERVQIKKDENVVTEEFMELVDDIYEKNKDIIQGLVER